MCGTHNKSIQRHLLQETKHKFEAALEMALSAEAADKDSKSAVLNDMLRDRLVCGTHNKSIQRRLLQETKLKFEAALEMALSAEAADKDSKRLTSSSSDKDLPTLQIGQIEDHPSTRSTAGRGYYTVVNQISLDNIVVENSKDPAIQGSKSAIDVEEDSMT